MSRWRFGYFIRIVEDNSLSPGVIDQWVINQVQMLSVRSNVGLLIITQQHRIKSMFAENIISSPYSCGMWYDIGAWWITHHGVIKTAANCYVLAPWLDATCKSC